MTYATAAHCLTLILLLAGGCATTLTPPANVQRPANVILLDLGGTSSIALPDAHGGMVRYVYGDWDWYALRKTGLYHGIAALCWPTQAALGRRKISSVPIPDTQNMYVLRVDQREVDRLRARLDALYQSQMATEVHTPDVGLDFVHHPDAYTFLHNSNHEVAKWLEELGVDVDGPALLSIWRVRQPVNTSPPAE